MSSALIGCGGYGREEPVLVGLQRGTTLPDYACQGMTGDGEPFTAQTRVYAASLSKQFTGLCAALLVTSGELDIASPLSDCLPQLPGWAAEVRVRHLIFHTAGLPEDVEVDDDQDRTSAGVLGALSRLSRLPRPPGLTFAYSNAGYVCLAAVVERAAGQSLPAFAERRLFGPLGMTNTLFWPGADASPAGSAPLRDRHPAPLSIGDGGAWSTAADLLRWNQAMNADELGVGELIQSPGSLDDGTPLDYGWGIGIRTHAGYRVYRHGGGWPGLRLLLARVPERSAGLVVIALADDTERRVDVAHAMLDTITVDPWLPA